MKYGLAKSFQLLRLALLLAAAWTLPAQADDYGTVSQLIRAGKLSEAQTKADQYLATKPRDPQMRFLKGVIQRESGKVGEALATFTRLTEDYPELPEPYNNLAVIYAGQGQYDKARAALEMAIRTNPSYATAHENLGDIYAKLASQAYNKALQLEGGNATAQPKLSLIREVFNPQGKGVKPGTPPAPAAPPVAPTPTPAPASTPAAPPAPIPAPAAPAARPAPAPTTAAAPVPPATAKPAPAPAPQQVAKTTTKDVEAAVIAWAKAWAGKDMKNYLGAYGPEFEPPARQSRKSWEEERRKRILGKSTISVKLENLTVQVNGNRAEAKFRQDYKADALMVSSRKTLVLVKTGERWLITRESTGT